MPRSVDEDATGVSERFKRVLHRLGEGLVPGERGVENRMQTCPTMGFLQAPEGCDERQEIIERNHRSNTHHDRVMP